MEEEKREKKGMVLSFALALTIIILWYGKPANAATARLCNMNGTIYRTMTVTAGSRPVFPSVYFPDKTFCGWVYKEGGKVVKAYAAGQKIPVENKTYYMSAYSMGGIKVLPAKKMLEPTTYSHVVIVGDSRTMLMKKNIGSMVKRTAFIFQNGGGLGWLQNTGYKNLKKLIEGRKEKTAVVFNMGVNDMWRVSSYISFYKKVAPVLKKKNCDLYIASVNPIDIKRMQQKGWGRLASSPATVVAFNKKLREGVPASYTWISTYAYLMKNGWTSGCSGNGDGLHYTKAVYQRIYNCIVSALNANNK